MRIRIAFMPRLWKWIVRHAKDLVQYVPIH